MKIILTFWKWTALWTVAVAAALVGVGAMTAEGFAPLLTSPTWLGMALALAAYPAGVAAGDDMGTEGRVTVARLAAFLGAAVSASGVAFALSNWVAPAVMPPDAATGLPTALSWTLGEMMDSLRVLGAGLPTGPAAVDAWLPYNHLAYQYVRRTDGMLLPGLFAWVGLLAGYCSTGIGEASLRRLAHWSLGAFLLVSTYMAGENGYELIVLRSAGRAEFAADLVLIVPGTLIIGLGLAAFAQWRRERGGGTG